MGLMFGGLLPSYPASQPWSVTNDMFRVPRPTKRAIKVISTLSGFATVERETIKWKTLKKWVKFGVAALRPWGEGQNLNPRENHPGHSGN